MTGLNTHTESALQINDVIGGLNKNHGNAVTSARKSTTTRRLRFGFRQRADALGAHHLAYLAPIFEDRSCLKIRPEGARRGFLRPRAVFTKSRLFTTMCTLSHTQIPFLLYPYHRLPVYGLCTGKQTCSRTILAARTAAKSYHRTRLRASQKTYPNNQF